MKRLTLFSLLFILTLTASLTAQVTIAPTNLFIDSNSKFGTYMVINGSNEPQEISVDFIFSYGALDSNGERKNVNDDPAIEEKYSIVDNVRAFPQNFLLQPGQRQIVRLRITGNTSGLDDGTYWARIKTSSAPQTPPVEVSSTSEVSARVSMVIEQVTGLFYKVGETTTGITIDGIRTSLSEDNMLTVLADIQRTGNSPFLGTITTSIINNKNETVRQAFVSTSIYFDGTHRQLININDLPSGTYTIKVDFVAERSDVSSNDIVSMTPASQSITYTVK